MLSGSSSSYRTPPQEAPSAEDVAFMQYAVDEAVKGAREGGVPIGACLVSKDGKVLGVGRNLRVQEGSAIKHGETSCLENIGRLPAAIYKGSTMYTTLSPCSMCTGAMILYGIPKVVIGENETFLGAEGILKDFGVKIINLNLEVCKKLMAQFIADKPEIWNEDVGED
ncbi:cytosine deaminase [Atractiella rhizophila]|nr:cytosine deaminase [Atractiella rhizophila]